MATGKLTHFTILISDRQTMLFSATQTQKVEDITRVCFAKTVPVYVGVDDAREHATVDTLEQVIFVFPTREVGGGIECRHGEGGERMV